MISPAQAKFVRQSLWLNATALQGMSLELVEAERRATCESTTGWSHHEDPASLPSIDPKELQLWAELWTAFLCPCAVTSSATWLPGTCLPADTFSFTNLSALAQLGSHTHGLDCRLETVVSVLCMQKSMGNTHGFRARHTQSAGVGPVLECS